MSRDHEPIRTEGLPQMEDVLIRGTAHCFTHWGKSSHCCFSLKIEGPYHKTTYLPAIVLWSLSLSLPLLVISSQISLLHSLFLQIAALRAVFYPGSLCGIWYGFQSCSCVIIFSLERWTQCWTDWQTRTQPLVNSPKATEHYSVITLCCT